jgi:hypothetical protein
VAIFPRRDGLLASEFVFHIVPWIWFRPSVVSDLFESENLSPNICVSVRLVVAVRQRDHSKLFGTMTRRLGQVDVWLAPDRPREAGICAAFFLLKRRTRRR